MKIDRMLSIIIYLSSHDRVKAADLAEKLEVSVRTIYRDIDAICQAGIPITTYQGKNGGIGVVEGFKIDKSIFSTEEIANILAGLRSINSISDDIKIRCLIEKFQGMSAQSGYLQIEPDILIDLSPWNKHEQLVSRIQQIRASIKDYSVIEFVYYTGEHITERRVEPYMIVFKQSNWYLYAFCLLRNDFRLFKLNRMMDISISEARFTPREYNLERVEWDGDLFDQQSDPVILIFKNAMKHAVHDIFGTGNYEIMNSGDIRVSMNYKPDYWLYGFILSFGNQVEVISPRGIRDKIKEIVEKTMEVYER